MLVEFTLSYEIEDTEEVGEAIDLAYELAEAEGFDTKTLNKMTVWVDGDLGN